MQAVSMVFISAGVLRSFRRRASAWCSSHTKQRAPSAASDPATSARATITRRGRPGVAEISAPIAAWWRALPLRVASVRCLARPSVGSTAKCPTPNCTPPAYVGGFSRLRPAAHALSGVQIRAASHASVPDNPGSKTPRKARSAFFSDWVT